MNSALTLLTTAVLTGFAASCATGTESLRIDRATVLGVYPPIHLPPEDYGDATQIEHLENAVLEARRCVPDESVDVHIAFAAVVVLHDGNTKHVLRFPAEYPGSVAGVLAKPGAEPFVVRTDYGPNELQLTLPASAATYFLGGPCSGGED